VYESDATDDQRQMYADVCGDLDCEPLGDDELARDEVVVIAFRGPRSDRRRIAELAKQLGVTQNALYLTAVRLGADALDEARQERG
jgi:hypothetical protein